MEGSAGDFEPPEFEVVEKGEASRLWTELIEGHHYLQYRVPVGANLRYLVRSRRSGAGVLACLLWSSPAWKMATRDKWIGWNAEQRTRNLQLIVNNSRFLVLPWEHVKGLASKILAQSARLLPSTGTTTTATDPFCWRPYAQRFSVALAIVQRTGSLWGKLKDVEEWIAKIVPTEMLQRYLPLSLCRNAQQQLCQEPSAQPSFPFQIVSMR